MKDVETLQVTFVCTGGKVSVPCEIVPNFTMLADLKSSVRDDSDEVFVDISSTSVENIIKILRDVRAAPDLFEKMSADELAECIDACTYLGDYETRKMLGKPYIEKLHKEMKKKFFSSMPDVPKFPRNEMIDLVSKYGGILEVEGVLCDIKDAYNISARDAPPP